MGGHVSRTTRSADMDSPTKRKSLEAGAYHQEPLLAGGYLRYRCPALDRAGAWFAQARNPDSGKLAQVRLASADDDRNRANGRDVMDYVQAREAAEAWVKAAAKKVQQELSGEVIQEGPYTVRDAWADYLKDAQRRGVKGVKIMGQTAEAHILPALGDKEVRKLTRKQIEDWHGDLALAPRRSNRKPDQPKKAEDPKPPEKPAEFSQDEQRARRDTANRILTNLKSALNCAADRGKTGDSNLPWRLVKPFKGTTSQRVRFLTVNEQQMLVAACDPEFRPLVMGALYTGARYGELCRVLARDFNATSRTLFIQWGKGKGEAVSRHVALSSEAVIWFKVFTEGRSPDELMWRRKDVERTTRAKTLADPDAWASYDQVYAMEQAVEIARARMKAADPKAKDSDFEDVTFHELRHTYASGLINAGCPLAYVAAQLGHKDTRMCERHYGHIARQALTASIEKLSPVLGLFTPNAAP